MKVTLSVIKADVGSTGGHTMPSTRMLEAVRTEVSTAIEVPSRAEKELRFVPVRKGLYDLECSVFLHDAFGMEGRITVQ